MKVEWKEKIMIIRKLLKTHNKGQIVIVFAFMLIGLIAAVGLAADSMILYVRKQDLQRSIDSAALIASRKLPNQMEAEKTAYEVMRLYGYDFDPDSNPLIFNYPVYDPPRKVISVEGTTEAELYFLQIIGLNESTVMSNGFAESSPMDIYLVLDLSLSMSYDTKRPKSLPSSTCSNWTNDTCIAQKCNAGRYCDPLDTKIKPAAKYFVDLMSSEFDRIGLVTYDYSGAHVHSLTNDFDALKDAIDDINVYEGDNRSTNTGDGLMYAHNKIAEEGRMDSIWSMVLLTDGRANVYRRCTGCPPACSTCTTIQGCSSAEGCTYATNWAVNNAWDTWTRHETVIYTIAYGKIFETNPDYQELMEDIADITDNGIVNNSTENFWVAPDENQLREALKEIAERIFTRLVK